MLRCGIPTPRALSKAAAAAATSAAAAAPSHPAAVQPPALPTSATAAVAKTATARSSYVNAIWGHRGQEDTQVPYEGEKGTMLRMLEAHPVEAEEQKTGTAKMPSLAEAGLAKAGAIRLEDPTQVLPLHPIPRQDSAHVVYRFHSTSSTPCTAHFSHA